MIISTQEIEQFIQDNRTSRFGFASGCFDLFHFYHLYFLDRCARKCDKLIVGVDADALIQELKHKTPQIPEFHRAAVVSALRCVHAVVIIPDLEWQKRISEKVSVVFKNGTSVYGKDLIAPGKTVVIPDVNEARSTSELIEQIKTEEEGRLRRLEKHRATSSRPPKGYDNPSLRE